MIKKRKGYKFPKFNKNKRLMLDGLHTFWVGKTEISIRKIVGKRKLEYYSHEKKQWIEIIL